MQPNGSLLAETSTGRLCQPDPLPEKVCNIELALFRARSAFEAGWQLEPAEIMTLVGTGTWPSDHPARDLAPETEDEIDDIPLYFGDRYSDVA